jgi:hypothetical protein
MRNRLPLGEHEPPMASAGDVVRQFYKDLWMEGDADAGRRLVATVPDGRWDHGLRGPLDGEQQAAVARGFRGMFPDLKVEIELLLEDGERVAARWRMQGTHAATGRRLEDYTGINLFRVVGREIVEIRNDRDDLGLMHQLGLVPDPGELWARAQGDADARGRRA